MKFENKYSIASTLGLMHFNASLTQRCVFVLFQISRHARGCCELGGGISRVWKVYAKGLLTFFRYYIY